MTPCSDLVNASFTGVSAVAKTKVVFHPVLLADPSIIANRAVAPVNGQAGASTDLAVPPSFDQHTAFALAHFAHVLNRCDRAIRRGSVGGGCCAAIAGRTHNALAF